MVDSDVSSGLAPASLLCCKSWKEGNCKAGISGFLVLDVYRSCNLMDCQWLILYVGTVATSAAA